MRDQTCEVVLQNYTIIEYLSYFVVKYRELSIFFPHLVCSNNKINIVGVRQIIDNDKTEVMIAHEI